MERLLIIIFALVSTLQASSIEIRQAKPQDVTPLMFLNCEISFEFFAPLFHKNYQQFEFAQDPTLFLFDEIVGDHMTFTDATNKNNNNIHLLYAYDTKNMRYAGFIVMQEYKEKCSAEISLLMVHKDYRSKGIGKNLVQAGLQLFPQTYTFFVTPLRIANDRAIHFYEKCGFTPKKNFSWGNKKNAYDVLYDDMYYMYVYEVTPK